VVMVENGLVTSLEEKSKNPKSNMINAGAYLFDADIFDAVDRVQTSSRGELELTDALMNRYSIFSLILEALWKMEYRFMEPLSLGKGAW